ncbi:MAG: hypothetical protein H7Z15_23210 [Rhizobacter sp.]|nr:hypothetical protein [Rhizobacter sp.]
MQTFKAGGCVVAVLLGLAAGSAFGQQMYRCKNGASTYVSDRPCPGSSDTRLTAYGPVKNAEPRPSYQPPLKKAPDHLRHLSAACAELNDAIRTAPARGVGRATQSDLRDEYQSKCQEDDEAARKRAMDDKRQQRDERKAEISARQAEQTRSAAAKEQCSELLRILSEKRKRLDAMTPGERSDHQRFETSYTERCK